MSQTLALIHTSPVLVPVFNALARQWLKDVRVFHVVDESLIQNTIRAGFLEKTTVRRLSTLVDNAHGGGADAVLVTCSSIGPGVPVARALFDFPVLRVDERMAERAIEVGRRIGVVATLRTTLDPTIELLESTAARLGRECYFVSTLCPGAFDAVLNGDNETHDYLVSGALSEMASSVDVIVLAQASMARAAQRVPDGTPMPPILSSPALAMEHARDILASLAHSSTAPAGSRAGGNGAC